MIKSKVSSVEEAYKHFYKSDRIANIPGNGLRILVSSTQNDMSLEPNKAHCFASKYDSTTGVHMFIKHIKDNGLWVTSEDTSKGWNEQ